MSSDPNLQSNQSFTLSPNKQVLFFGDPMCSWCWGFAPVLKQISNSLPTHVEMHLIMGGLRPKTSEPWDLDLRVYIQNHWRSVAETTGQSFDFARFDDEDFIYDTEPACRAVVTVRKLCPQNTFVMFNALQKAFYAKGQNIKQTKVLATIAKDCDINQTEFLKTFMHPDTKELTQQDFLFTKSMGVMGYPTVLGLHNQQPSVLSAGYQTFETLTPKLEEWLNT